LAESIKLEQKKEDLLVLCEKNLNKIVADALACILASEKTILREKTACPPSPIQICRDSRNPFPANST
jgi:hypothetical protein